MESQVFRWLCVNVFEMLVLLSGVSAFLFLKVQLEHYMQNWPLKVSSGVLLSAAHVSVHHVSSCCVSLALNLRELCSFFSFRYLRYLCPCLHIALCIGGLCYLCAISCHLCAISALSLWYFFEIFVYTPWYIYFSKTWRQELAVPNLMVPWNSGPKDVLSFWWSWGDSWSVHRLGLSN